MALDDGSTAFRPGYKLTIVAVVVSFLIALLLPELAPAYYLEILSAVIAVESVLAVLAVRRGAALLPVLSPIFTVAFVLFVFSCHSVPYLGGWDGTVLLSLVPLATGPIPQCTVPSGFPDAVVYGVIWSSIRGLLLTALLAAAILGLSRF